MIDSVIIEKPISWMENKEIGPVVTSLYDELYKEIKEKNLQIQTVNIFGHSITDNPIIFYNRTPNFNKNTLYLSYHTYGDHKKNLWRIKESYIPNYFSIDSMGYSGFSYMASNQPQLMSSLNIDLDTANEFVSNTIKNLSINNESKYPQPEFNDIFTLQDYIFFPLQIDTDTVISLSYFDYYELILSIINNITDYPIVIKPHPKSKNINKLLKIIQQSNANVIISDLSIHQLIQNALCCITINSGVGFECLLYGKPVLAFGKSDYDSCTTICNHQKDINNRLVEKTILSFDSAYVNKFLYYYLNYYCISIDNMYAIKKILNKGE
jgi:hypothetical protein